MPDEHKTWLGSHIYDEAPWKRKNLPRTSLFKFGSFSDAFWSIAKIAGQSAIAWMLLSLLYIVLVEASQESDQYQLAAGEIVKLICFTISVFLAARVFDDTNIQDMGLRLSRMAMPDFLVGFGVVFLLLTFEFLFELAVGALRIDGVAWQIMPFSGVLLNLLICLVIFLFVGWSEELLSRGFHLRILSKGINRPIGVLVSSLLFSYLHHTNPNMTVESYISIFLFGIVCAIAFLRSGNLWLAMGLHAGWDYFVVVFWGVPISGLRVFHLMNVRAVPGIVTSSFVLELISLGVITAVVYLYTLHRQGVKDW